MTYPAPVGGWNARDSLAEMPITDAVQLVNYNPIGESVQLRNGHTQFSTGMGSGPVERLFEYYSAAGTRKLIACADNKIWDASTATATNITGAATVTSNRWQGVTYRDKLYLVNGADAPLESQGTSVTATAWTAETGMPTLTKANLVNVSVYKERLYFVEKNTTAYWYTKAALTDLKLYWEDVGQFLSRGGALIYAGSWTRGTADTSSDLFVIITNQGEALVYQGLDPSASDWSLVGHYFVGRPLGYRAVVNVGADLLLIAEDGVYPFSSLLQQLGATAYTNLTDKIRNAWRESTAAFSTNEGWCALNYPNSNQLLINVPLSSNLEANQYVLNTKLGAWCKWTGINACSWALYNGNPMFGGPTGKVFRADYGQTDNNSEIASLLQTSFSTHKDRSMKQWLLVQPMGFATAETSFLLDVATDYRDKVIDDNVVTIASEGATWDEATWDVSPWAEDEYNFQDWSDLQELGYAGSIILKGSFKNMGLKLNAINVIYARGGVL